MSLEESVHNYIFRGTLINGVATISRYNSIYGTGITTDCLRGMNTIVNNTVTDYPFGHIPQGVGAFVVSNTAWADGGFSAVIGGSDTYSGLVDIAFVYPVGRLAITTSAIASKSQPALPVSNQVKVESIATPPLPSEGKCGIVVRGAPDCLVTSDISTHKLRAGQQWRSY